MARFSILALAVVFSTLLMSPSEVKGCANGAPEFTIYGEVLCQDCTKDWNTYRYAATPIKGAKVDITCPDKNGRPVYHYSDLTDDKGVFRVTLPYNYNGVALNPQQAVVRLVSSGTTDCNIMSNFNHGKEGVCPQNPTTCHPDIVEYLVGPLHFTTAECAIDDQ